MDVREKLVELLSKYFNIGDSYAYNLTRVKSAFACGTIGLDDFEEFDDETVEDIASYLIEHGVTVQEWISVDDRLPSDEQDVLVIAHGWGGRLVYVGSYKRVEAQKSWLTGITSESSEWSLWGWSYLKEPMVTHWMPLPEPPKADVALEGGQDHA